MCHRTPPCGAGLRHEEEEEIMPKNHLRTDWLSKTGGAQCSNQIIGDHAARNDPVALLGVDCGRCEPDAARQLSLMIGHDRTAPIERHGLVQTVEGEMAATLVSLPGDMDVPAIRELRQHLADALGTLAARHEQSQRRGLLPTIHRVRGGRSETVCGLAAADVHAILGATNCSDCEARKGPR